MRRRFLKKWSHFIFFFSFFRSRFSTMVQRLGNVAQAGRRAERGAKFFSVPLLDQGYDHHRPSHQHACPPCHTPVPLTTSPVLLPLSPHTKCSEKYLGCGKASIFKNMICIMHMNREKPLNKKSYLQFFHNKPLH